MTTIQCDATFKNGTLQLSNTEYVTIDGQVVFVSNRTVPTDPISGDVYCVLRYRSSGNSLITIKNNAILKYSINVKYRLNGETIEDTISGVVSEAIPYGSSSKIRINDPYIVDKGLYRIGDTIIESNENTIFDIDFLLEHLSFLYIKYGYYQEYNLKFVVPHSIINKGEMKKINGYVDSSGEYVTIPIEELRIEQIEGNYIVDGKVIVEDGLFLSQGEKLQCKSLVVY